ncbi:MAG TPA: histidine kinase [Bacteroidia bacterium]|nr:histidine kinase [Bacteroidia bacterium]
MLINVRIRGLVIGLFSLVACINVCIAQVPVEHLSVWFRADKNVVIDRDSVLQWNDCSANQVSTFSVMQLKPILVSNAINGKPAVRFNGRSNGLLSSQPIKSFETLRGTIIIVMKTNGRSYQSSVGSGNVLSTYIGDGMAWQFSSTTSKFSFYDGNGGEGTQIGLGNPLDWCITSLVRKADTLVDFYFNGRVQNNFPVKGIPSNINTLKIGYNGSKSLNPSAITEVFNGDIAEILIYDVALSEDQLASIHDYLFNKYAINQAPKPYYQQFWFYALIVLVIVLLILLIWKFSQTRRIKKQLAILAVQQALDKERKRIAGDMHDEIGSGISRIALLTQVLKQQIKDENLHGNLDKLKSISQDLGGQLNEMIWSVNPEQDKLDRLLGYIRYYVVELLEENNINVSIDFPDLLNDKNILPDFRMHLFYITKESVNNALKYSGTVKMELNFRIDEYDKFLYSIKDFGKGFDPENVRAFSNGLSSLRNRAKSIGCELEIDTKTGQGTEIRVSGIVKYYESSSEG